MNIEHLWVDFLHSRRNDSRQLLIEHYWPMVKKVARKMHGRLPDWVDYDDVVSWGTAGLISAVDNYNFEKVQQKGTSRGLFEAYALTRIRGTIYDELRSADWAPRSLRKAQKRIEEAREAVECEGHEASIHDIAEAADLSEEEVSNTLQRVDVSYLRSLDEVHPDDGSSSARSDSLPDEAFPQPERRASFLMMYETSLEEVFEHLSVLEKTTLALHYYKRMTLSEVAERLGVPDSRVSKAHKQALARVQSVLRDEFSAVQSA